MLQNTPRLEQFTLLRCKLMEIRHWLLRLDGGICSAAATVLQSNLQPDAKIGSFHNLFDPDLIIPQWNDRMVALEQNAHNGGGLPVAVAVPGGGDLVAVGVPGAGVPGVDDLPGGGVPVADDLPGGGVPVADLPLPGAGPGPNPVPPVGLGILNNIMNDIQEQVNQGRARIVTYGANPTLARANRVRKSLVRIGERSGWACEAFNLMNDQDGLASPPIFALMKVLKVKWKCQMLLNEWSITATYGNGNGAKRSKH